MEHHHILWCDELFQSSENSKPSSKSVRDQSESDSGVAKEKQQSCEEKVRKIVDSLKEKRSSNFTHI